MYVTIERKLVPWFPFLFRSIQASVSKESSPDRKKVPILKVGSLIIKIILMSELQLQASCFQWFWNNYPELRRLLWAIPNGGSRNKAEATQLKASGLLKGVSDMHLFVNDKFYVFELKVGSNKLTEDQTHWQLLIIEHGGNAYTIRTLDEFKEIIKLIVGY